MNTVTIHRRAICYSCGEEVHNDPVFAPPLCDHVDCASAVFHGVCLMTWRERLAAERDHYLAILKRHEDRACSCYEDDE